MGWTVKEKALFTFFDLFELGVLLPLGYDYMVELDLLKAELDHALQQVKQKDPQYFSKQLDNLKLQTSNISYLVDAVDVLF
ncbi:hypothetical protein QOT17_024231, partial [Balamuthia mandrillaris]